MRSRATAADGLRDKRTITEYKVLVRWESGLPVRLAHGIPSLPNDDVPHYILSVSRVPFAFAMALSPGGPAPHDGKEGPSRAEMAERIWQSSSLQLDGSASIRADHANWAESDFEASTMIYFPQDRQPIGPSEREVTFVSQIGALVVRASFHPKEMIYLGKLEL
jgi:hypothetical protein